jgi:hypothetical protein
MIDTQNEDLKKEIVKRLYDVLSIKYNEVYVNQFHPTAVSLDKINYDAPVVIRKGKVTITIDNVR